jgi:Family of unknown function (DUF5670)
MFWILWIVIVFVVFLWALGFSLHIAGGLIHLLLVAALVLLPFDLISGRKPRAQGL